MPAVTRKGDLCSGHGTGSCWPARVSTGGSSNVFVNGDAAHRKSDIWAVHSCPNNGSHSGLLSSGSSTVNVNGKPLGRIGDKVGTEVSCSSKVAGGSENVFAGPDIPEES